MPRINNIPQAMLREHVAWHSRPGNPSAGGRRIDPFSPDGRRPALGSGEEFLLWHSGFVERFHQWVNNLPENQRPPADAISPWHEIPQMLKMSMLGWNARLAEEERQLSDMSNFDSLDELGRFLEWSLHGFLHNAAAGMWNERVLLSFESPRSTYFWQLHGLIDYWVQQWMDYNDNVNNNNNNNSNGNVNSNEEDEFTPLPIDAGAIQARIESPAEVDRYSFNVDSESRLVVETTGPSDTIVYIAGPNNPRRLHSSDDDSGQNFNASIDAQFTPGEYFIYVVLYDHNQTGNYGISVSSRTTLSLPQSGGLGFPQRAGQG